jgi:hypothetical protein
MKKGVVVAACVAVLAVAGTGLWWWMGRDKAASSSHTALIAPKPAVAMDPVKRAAWIKQRIEQRRYLWREASYIDVRQKALDGDLLAQRRLSEIYEDCIAFAGSLRSSVELLGDLATADPSSRAAVGGIYRDRNRLCKQAGADLQKNNRLAEYWLHKSAKGGDLTAEMRYFTRTVSALNMEQFAYFIEKTRTTGDPDAMFEVSLLLSRVEGKWPDAALAPAFRGPFAEQAWALAACRAGFDCAAGSRLMNLLCISMLSCKHADYESHLRATAGYAAKRPEIERLIAIIDRDILAPKAK